MKRGFRELNLKSEEDEKEQKLFSQDIDADTIRIGLSSNKAIGIAKLISETFRQNRKELTEKRSKCHDCQKAFMVLFRSRYNCSVCNDVFCNSCLKYQFDIYCHKLPSPMIDKVAKILNAAGHISNRALISFKICAECFNQLCLEIERLERNNRGKSKMSKQESMYDVTGGSKVSIKAHLSPNNRRRPNKKYTGSFNMMPSKTPDIISESESKTSAIMRQSKLFMVPGVDDLTADLEKMELSESLTFGVIDNFISRLLNLEFNDDLPFNLALEQMVKIYAVNNRVQKFSEESEKDHFQEGEVRIINGTIVQKVLRFKHLSEETSINNILLMSLPITSPYRILDKEFHAKNAKMSFRDDPYTLIPETTFIRETSILPQASDLNDSTRNSHIFGHRETVAATVLLNNKMEEKSKIRFPEDLYISLESLTFVKNQFTNYIKDHIKKNQIELIFSTETIPSSLFEELKDSGVVVIFPISQAEIKLLSVVLNAQIISDVETLTKDLGQEYLGNIRNYHIVDLVTSENNYQTSLIFLDKLEPLMAEVYSSLGVTIYSANISESLQLKTFLRDNLTYIYFSLVEHDFVMKESDTTGKPLLESNPLNYSMVGDFRAHLAYYRKNLRQMMKNHKQMFQVTEVELTKMDIDNVYPDIEGDFYSLIDKFFQKVTTADGLKNQTDIQKKIEKSILNPEEHENFSYLYGTDLDILANLNITKSDRIVAINGTPQQFLNPPYSETDMTLNKYLKTRFAQMEYAISKVENYQYKKQFNYYVADSCISVKLEMSSKEASATNFVKSISSLSKHDQYNKGLYIYRMFHNLEYELYQKSSFKSIRTTQFNNIQRERKGGRFSTKPRPTLGSPAMMTGSMIARESTPFIQIQPVHQTGHIRSYIVCEVCNKVLSHTMVMNDIHKNLSFTMFLYSMGVNRTKKGRRDLSNLPLSFQEMDHPFSLKEDFCKHDHQSRAFTLGQFVIKFKKHTVVPNKLVHFRHRELLQGTNSITNEYRKISSVNKLQFEDKIAKEMGEYFIRQICFMTNLMRDVILKGNRIMAKYVKEKDSQKLKLHLALIKLYSSLSDLASKFWFVMSTFSKIELNFKFNHMLRSIMLNLKIYEKVLADVYLTLFGKLREDRIALYYTDIIMRLCKLDKDYSTVMNYEIEPIRKAKKSEVIREQSSVQLMESPPIKPRPTKTLQNRSVKRSNTMNWDDPLDASNSEKPETEDSVAGKSKDFRRHASNQMLISS